MSCVYPQEPTCVIVKHTNPCGVATRGDLLEAYRLAVIADPVSAFGGIVAFNRVVDEKLARELREFRCDTSLLSSVNILSSRDLCHVFTMDLARQRLPLAELRLLLYTSECLSRATILFNSGTYKKQQLVAVAAGSVGCPY